METKTCKDCCKEFGLTRTFFYLNPKAKDGLDVRCIGCRKEYSKKWNFAHRKISSIPEGMKKCTKCKEVLPKTQEYFKLQEDKFYWGSCNTCRNLGRRERDKAYYDRTRDKQAESRKSWRNANKDAQAQWQKGYYATPTRRYKHYRSAAKQRDIGFELTFEEFQEFWGQPCYYCADSIETVGLDRVDSSIGYVFFNVVSCCKKCNFAKHLMNEDEFVAHCEKIVNNFNVRKLKLRVVV